MPWTIPDQTSSQGLFALWARSGPVLRQRCPRSARKLEIHESGHGIASQTTEALAAVGPAAVPALIKILDGDNPDAQWRAMLILERLGPAAKDAAPALARLVALHDRTDTWRGVSTRRDRTGGIRGSPSSLHRIRIGETRRPESD